jgi:3-deoxy-D-manno-octulosonic-acid transferase
VPRHPQRGPAVAQIAAASGLQVQLRSRGHLPSADTDIYVADTMGELGLFYRIAPVVFMGGSLVMHGGQNPIEPAKLDAAILHGPHVFNFSDIYAALDREEGALLAHDPEEFVTLLRHLLGNPIARSRLAASAQTVVTRLGGAVDKTMAALEPYLLQMRIEQGATDA